MEFGRCLDGTWVVYGIEVQYIVIYLFSMAVTYVCDR